MIRVGIGGWTFAPWCGSFYPEGLPHARELAYACSKVTAIEVNGTFYRTQTPATFRKWAEEAPDGFVFALKGHRSVTNRGRLAEAGPAIARFVESGIAELGDKLGPINWQLAPTKKFDPEDLDTFLALLPREVEGRPLRHAIEVRHQSFVTPDFVALARRHGVAIVFAEADDHPLIADQTADFIYARLQRAREGEPDGYPAAELDLWAERAKIWRQGGAPGGLQLVEPAIAGKSSARDVFVFFISGDKVRNPAAATALIERL
jgi:uncharacterized protein YecE (DUF72 family)